MKNVSAKRALVLGAFAAIVATASGVFATFYTTQQSGMRCNSAYGYGDFGYGYGYGYGYDCTRRTTGGGGSYYVAPTSGNITTGTVATGTQAPFNTGAAEVVKTFLETAEGKTAVDSLANSPYEAEWNNAYLFARANGITTMATVQAAQMTSKVTRGELAKMLSVFAQKFANKTAIEGKAGCAAFADLSTAAGDLSGYIKTACELEIMGLDSDGKTPLKNFYPNRTVTRAEMVTVLSRVLFGNQYDNNSTTNWWANHMTKLHADGIIKNTNPSLEELRAYIFLMMYRMKGK